MAAVLKHYRNQLGWNHRLEDWHLGRFMEGFPAQDVTLDNESFEVAAIEAFGKGSQWRFTFMYRLLDLPDDFILILGFSEFGSAFCLGQTRTSPCSINRSGLCWYVARTRRC